jgi:hypothetical protein
MPSRRLDTCSLMPYHANVIAPSASAPACRPNEQRERANLARPLGLRCSSHRVVGMYSSSSHGEGLQTYDSTRGEADQLERAQDHQFSRRLVASARHLTYRPLCRPFSFKMLSVSPDLNLSPLLRDFLRDYPRFTPNGGVHPSARSAYASALSYSLCRRRRSYGTVSQT